ncbi:MAG: PAS domain S-box protein, partial [Spirochaetota bacterium]
DGTEAAERILAEVNVPVVFLTSHTEREYVDRVRDITSYGYVAKHSGEFVLIESIRMALQLFDAHRDIATKEERLEQIVDEAPVGLFAAHRDGKLQRVNPELARILGFYSPTEAVKRCRDIGTEVFKRPEQWRELVRALDEHGVVRDFRIEARRSNGETAFLKLSARRFRDENNRVTGISGYIVDETDQHRAEQDLQQANRERDSIIELTQELIVRHDREGRWTFVNDRACEFFGQSRDQLMGQHFLDFVHPDDVPATRSAGETMALSHSSVMGLTNRQKTPRGWRTVRWNSAPILDETGRYLGHQATGRDITAEKQLQAELEQKNRELTLILDSSPLMIFYKDTAGRHVFANVALADALGVSKEEIVGKLPSDLFPKEQARPMEEHDREVLATGTSKIGEEERYSQHGTSRWARTSRVPMRDDQGRIVGLVGFVEDITDRRRMEQHLLHYKLAVDSLDQIVVAVDKEARYLLANRAFLTRHQLSEEEVVGRPAWDVLGAEVYEEHVRPHLEKALRGQTVTFDMQIHYPGDDLRHLNVSYYPIRVDGTVEGVVSVKADVTDYVRVQERHRHQEMRARWLSGIAARVLSGWSIQELVERAVEEIGGEFPELRAAYSTVDAEGVLRVLASTQPEGMPSIEGVEADLNEAPGYLRELRQGKPLAVTDIRGDERFAPLHSAMEAGNTRALLDVPLTHSDNVIGLLCLDSPVKRRWHDDEVRTLQEIADYLTLAIQNERSRRALEESEERYRRIVDDAPIGIATVDSDGRFRTANPFLRNWLGYSERELRELSVEEVTLEQRCIRRDGSLVWGDWVTSTMYRGDPEKRVGLAMVVDVTERKEAEKQLKAALRAKDHVMSELNHRVKNNLAMVLSLIHLKQAVLGDAVDLSDIASQINAIRFIHEKLQHSEDTSRIDFGTYAADVVRSVISAGGDGGGTGAEIDIGIDDVVLPTKVATTLGLILNELAMNAVKHGFTPDTDKRFGLRMETDEGSNEYVLVVSNTGRAFPDNIDIEQPNTLGLQLVTALTDQLGGSLELERSPHPVFTIRFPIPA